MVEIQSTNYSVWISTSISKELLRFFKKNKGQFSRLVILVDENSLRYCYPQLVTAVPQLEDAEIIEVDSGEESKNIDVCAQIWRALSEFGADRKTLFINLGGGVISDLGGFVASTYKRGIPFINIPTSLLAQVDASVGGKVGIDLDHLKNQVGVFADPKAVFIGSEFIASLDLRQRLSGFAEILKHGLIADRRYWNELKSLDLSDHTVFDALIPRSIKIKNDIVMQDPREKELRKSLNFGHTIGHAIEAFSLEHHNKNNLLHGEAIAVGMICEAFLSRKIAKLSALELDEITDTVFSYFPSIRIDKMDQHRLIELMKNDKKNEADKLMFTLLPAIGKCVVNKAVASDLISDALQYYSTEVKLRNKKA